MVEDEDRISNEEDEGIGEVPFSVRDLALTTKRSVQEPRVRYGFVGVIAYLMIYSLDGARPVFERDAGVPVVVLSLVAKLFGAFWAIVAVVV